MKYSPLKEFVHIPLEWKRNPHNKREWFLVFDREPLLSVKQAGGLLSYFFPKVIGKADVGSWSVRVKGRGPHLYEFSRADMLGLRKMELGFKNKYKEGMFNPDRHHSFLWKPQVGNTKAMAWHLDDLEVVRFEKSGGVFSSGPLRCNVAKGDFKESWLAIMLISGFMALRHGKI